jgi:two-component system alkaline phosphatase synthesis response regulator PhoP
MAMQQRFDLILLDVMLPGMDGFEVCRRLRANGSNVPVLFLTARSGRDDRIRGLREGGDDYLTKPFDLQEMLARVAAILRRQRWYAAEGSEGMLRFGGNQVDLLRYCGTDRHGVEHELTHKEAQILKCLADLEGQVVTRDQILDRVWGDGRYPSSRTIDNFIVKLRRRFEHFHTIHGAGYRFTRDPVR